MNDVTFLDALEYCEVHGHDIEFVEQFTIDIIGNQVKHEICRQCRKERKTMVQDERRVRMSEQYYPDGGWR